MATRTRTILGSTLLVLLVAVGGLAAAHPDDEYPPTPPTETELPTETPSPTETVSPTETTSPTETVSPTETPSPTESPTEGVLPTETVAPTETSVPTETPTEVEVLPRVLERLPLTGTGALVLFTVAVALIAGGVVATRVSRRRHDTPDT